MNQFWEQEATALVEQIRSAFRLAVKSERLTDRLLELRLTPLSGESTPIALVISADQVIFSAGDGTRFELPPLPDSTSELVRLVKGVAHGGLTETMQRGRVSFELRLDDGIVLTGASSRLSSPSGTGGRRVIHYEGYCDSQ